MPCASGKEDGSWWNPRLPWDEEGAMGCWNSGGLIESERQFSADGLRASGAQRLCGKDIFCVLQGGEPKGEGARACAASAAPRRAELRDLLGQPRCEPGEVEHRGCQSLLGCPVLFQCAAHAKR